MVALGPEEGTVDERRALKRLAAKRYGAIVILPPFFFLASERGGIFLVVFLTSSGTQVSVMSAKRASRARKRTESWKMGNLC